MRLFTNKNQDLLSHFDNTDESQNGFKGSSLNSLLIDNHY